MQPVDLIAGDTWAMQWRIDPAAYPGYLTGATAKLHVRHPITADLMLSAATGGFGMTIDATAGTVSLSVDKAYTTLDPGLYPFMLELSWPDGRRQSFPEHTLRVQPDRTY